MTETTIHNPDRYMVDLRQILSQGRKRIGLLIGAGAPVSISDDKGNPLMPDVESLTARVQGELTDGDKAVINALRPQLGDKPNIETILTQVRQLSQVIGTEKVHEYNGEEYKALAERICASIGKIVAPKLPKETNPYTELVSWIGGTHREHPVEIFTPNYDLLIEEAFERAKLPYFDGFSGAHRPFFDPASISEDVLPARWSRLWKIHGSLGWEVSGDTIIRTGSREATTLIYPDHLKYDQITRQPYSAFFERLRKFLTTPDSLMLCTGFSFFDAHITSVLDEALAANKHTAIIAFQFRSINESEAAIKIAQRRPNLSVYAQDGAVIHGVSGGWQLGESPSNEWESIRRTFWKAENSGEFLLGDFAKLARFFALTQTSDFRNESEESSPEKDMSTDSQTGIDDAQP